MRFGLYASTSLIAGAGLVAYTYHTRQQFYPTVIYLVTSKVSVMVLCNVAFVLTILCGRVFKRIFLGTLRDAELEMLYDHARFAIAETCFTLSVFREEMTLKVLALFTLLLFIKTFHWLCQWRGEHIEQSEVVSRSTHVRLVMLMSLLAAVDMSFVVLSAVKVLERGPSVLVLFGFEFLVLFVSLVAVFMRYVLHLIDARVDGTWANKFTYVFYLELITEIVKLIVYLVHAVRLGNAFVNRAIVDFFMIIFTYYGMPLHLLRDLWMSIRNLQRRIITYFRYRRITANMNERFPSPTEDELNDTDRICIICREEMTPETCKKLPCSHIFHLNCLRMWLQRQQTCPTCRANIPTDRQPDVVPDEAANLPVAPPPVEQPQPAVPEANNAPPPPVAPRNAPPPPLHRQTPYQPPVEAQRAAPERPAAVPPPVNVGGPVPVAGGAPFPPLFATPPPPISGGVAPPPALHGIMDPAQLHYMQSLHYGLQLDPMYLQYQLDMLQAQLHVLRATSVALQTGSLTTAGFAMPPNAAYAPATPFSAPTPPPTSAPVAAPAPSTISVSPAAAPTPAPFVAETMTPPAPSTPMEPAPVSAPVPSTPMELAPVSVTAPMPTTPVEPASAEPKEPTPAAAPLSEEEVERLRRRDELRRIYAKRYADSSESATKDENEAE
ncbi:hypothetical protein SPRG_06240 [Saprolegnia parasitica CBS 223.65]|uniref:RING-type E3 ubiquitin transferase n=1 Tax=Saprolegnia parasitica (strain CBS 223.65) TaxID=695850 RepID=A0A067CN42_SAPPC|nr:hypothetical protein SPRG_06240 [Saprolegnia parasitica CBS 223.65]KDO28192.1 hypothetical protein SPRG_06240 [Saprolegnia parasitica CBS 223.65]|eukprot:XP_012201018.1 hypothetical protein SPRG_06240 [Saprolegnia parasitica CBS 223.65]